MKDHWEKIHRSKSSEEVSWAQDVPEPSLRFIDRLQLSANAAIIDIGGGDSKLVDYLLEKGYQNLSVLDVSEAALNKAAQRLGDRAQEVDWIVSDIMAFEPQRKFDLWHDRATFHFLTEQEQVNRYVRLVENSVDRFLMIATFSDNGPEKCSGLPVEQYDEQKIERLFSENFSTRNTWREIHKTPQGAEQEFLFYTAERR